jgi:Skp family chaperone for outer membrane proteins
MLQKLQQDGVKSTKLTSSSANLRSDMKKHWKQQKRQDNIDDMRKKVAESLTPLQRLEQEWVALQDDIEQKKKMLHDKEEEIRKLAEEAKALALKAERSSTQQ